MKTGPGGQSLCKLTAEALAFARGKDQPCPLQPTLQEFRLSKESAVCESLWDNFVS